MYASFFLYFIILMVHWLRFLNGFCFSATLPSDICSGNIGGIYMTPLIYMTTAFGQFGIWTKTRKTCFKIFENYTIIVSMQTKKNWIRENDVMHIHTVLRVH